MKSINLNYQYFGKKMMNIIIEKKKNENKIALDHVHYVEDK